MRLNHIEQRLERLMTDKNNQPQQRTTGRAFPMSLLDSEPVKHRQFHVKSTQKKHP